MKKTLPLLLLLLFVCSACMPFLPQLPNIGPSTAPPSLQPTATPAISALSGVRLYGTGQQDGMVNFEAANEAVYYYKVMEAAPEKASAAVDNTWQPIQGKTAQLSGTGGLNIAVAVVNTSLEVLRFGFYTYVPGFLYYPADGSSVEGQTYFSPGAVNMLSALSGMSLSLRDGLGRPLNKLYETYGEGHPYKGLYTAGADFAMGFLQPLYAPLAGEVTAVVSETGTVALYLSNDITLFISGLQTTAVSVGQQLEAGSFIGIAGDKGTYNGLVRVRVEARPGRQTQGIFYTDNTAALLQNSLDPRVLFAEAPAFAGSPYLRLGNTPGNINNKGMAFYLDGAYYYSNDDDRGRLYQFSPATGESTRLSKDTAAFITGCNGWLYYSNLSDNSRLYKIRTDGTDRKKLLNSFSDYLTLQGDWIYFRNYTKGSKLYRVRTDGTDAQELYSGMSWSYVLSNGGLFFVNGSKREHIYFLTVTDLPQPTPDPSATAEPTGGPTATPAPAFSAEAVEITDHSAAFLETDGASLYYVNKTDGNKIYKAKTDGSEPALFLDESAEMLCYYNGFLYFVAMGDNQKIARVRTDGTGRETVVEKAYCTDLCITGNALYYRQDTGDQPQFRLNLFTFEEQQLG